MNPSHSDTPDQPTPHKRRKRAPNSGKQHSSEAQREIDSRLAQALRERAEAMRKISILAYHQGRLSQLNQEIESLIGFQQRLIHGHAAPVIQQFPPSGFAEPMQFSHLAEIPSGIGSVPTKTAKPAATPNGNAADVIGNEGGFN